MSAARTLLFVVLLIPILVAGCGEEEGASSERDARDAGAEQAEQEDEAPAGGRVSAASFSITPELQQCMEEAGYTQDAPPTASLAAWRHTDGSRVVVASSEEASVTGGIAAEIGTTHEAQVDGALVIAAPDEQAQSARDCLQ